MSSHRDLVQMSLLRLFFFCVAKNLARRAVVYFLAVHAQTLLFVVLVSVLFFF